MPALRGVRYTVEPGSCKRVRGGKLCVDTIVANGKRIGTIEDFSKGGHKKSRTCSNKLKTCKRGRDLVWLLEAANLMGARRRRR
jgi:hypothetical protein